MTITEFARPRGPAARLDRLPLATVLVEIAVVVTGDPPPRPAPSTAVHLNQHREEAPMYIGLGTVVLIVAIIILFGMMRGRRA